MNPRGAEIRTDWGWISIEPAEDFIRLKVTEDKGDAKAIFLTHQEALLLGCTLLYGEGVKVSIEKLEAEG